MASAVGRRLAKAHRSTRNDHVHRNARLGSRRSEQITFGISRQNQKLVLYVFTAPDPTVPRAVLGLGREA